MARMLSLIASGIRGSVGGLTFLSNPFHQIVIRQRTAPVDPSTNAQGSIRSAMISASATWDTLLPTPQEQWQAWSDTIHFSGPLGDYSVPGRQLFVAARALQNRLIDLGATISQVVTVPSVNSLLQIGSVKQVDLESPGTGVGLDITNDDTDDAMVMVQRSIPFTHSRKTFKGPFLSSSIQYLSISGGNHDQIDFSGLEDGKIYFFKISAVTDDSAPRFSKFKIYRGIAAETAA